MLEQGVALVKARGIASDLDLGPLVDPTVPFDGNPVLLQRLTHMYDAGAWVLMESALADLPADLRWLFESGAVTLPQLAAIHAATGATAASDIAAAIEDGTLRAVPGIDEAAEKAIAAALPALRATIPRMPLGRAIASGSASEIRALASRRATSNVCSTNFNSWIRAAENVTPAPGWDWRSPSVSSKLRVAASP